MFLHQCWSVRNAIQIKDYYDNVLQVFYVWSSYVIVSSQIYFIKGIRKEQETIRRFVNQRKLLRNDERAFKKRARGFRYSNMIVLSPLILTSVNMSLLLNSGTLLTPEYIVRLQLDEKFQLISQAVLLVSVAIISFSLLVMLITYVFINTLLVGLTIEAEILGDFFAGLESRIGAIGMDRDATSILLRWRNELKVCIGVQQEYLDCVQSLKRITKPLAFVQYYVSFLFIAECIWMAFYGKQSVTDMCFMFFALFFGSQCGLMFYLVERLEEEVIWCYVEFTFEILHDDIICSMHESVSSYTAYLGRWIWNFLPETLNCRRKFVR